MDIEGFYTELRTDPLTLGYAGMTDEQLWTALTTANRTRVSSKFGSFRTMAGLLTGDEYYSIKSGITALKTYLQSVSSPEATKVADMEAMLAVPGDSLGNYGGIDFGSAGTRTLLDLMAANNIITEALATKIKAYAEESVSRLQELNSGDCDYEYMVYLRGQLG